MYSGTRTIPHASLGVNPKRPSLRSQQGAGMIEILVSLLVIAIGLLGVAGLTSTAHSYNKTAQIRLVGLSLAQEYAERARSNIYGFDLKKYDITAADTKPSRTTFTAADANEADAKTAAEKVATHDRAAFMNEVADRLPGGSAIAASTLSVATGARDLDVWLTWQEPGTQEASNPMASACPTGVSGKSCLYFKVGL